MYVKVEENCVSFNSSSLEEENHIPRNGLKPYLVYVKVEENCVSFNSSSLGEEIHIPRNGDSYTKEWAETLSCVCESGRKLFPLTVAPFEKRFIYQGIG